MKLGADLIFHAIPLTPMGSSAMLMKDEIYLPYSDEKMSLMPVTIACTADHVLPVGLGKMLLWNVRDSYPVEATWIPPMHDTPIHWYLDEFSQILPMPDRKDGPIRHLELFAGGHGGWAYATRFLREMFNVPSQIVAIEHDLHILSNYAVNHGAMLISGDSPLPKGLLDSGLDVAIHMDVTTRACLPQLSQWNPDIATISAPCGPWSKAGAETGLASQNGLVFAEAVAVLRWIRPRIILMENVPGFPCHPHSKLILQQLKAAGYRVRWCKVIDVAAWTCVQRNRWLCVATLLNDPQVKFEHFEMWPVGMKHTPTDMNTILPLSHEMIEQLLIPEHVRKLCSDPRFLPLGHVIRSAKMLIQFGIQGDLTGIKPFPLSWHNMETSTRCLRISWPPKDVTCTSFGIQREFVGIGTHLKLRHTI